MASAKAVVFISGVLNWAKITADPVPNFAKDAREWTFEIEPDEKGMALLAKHGLTDRVKGKGFNIGTKGQHAERTPFIQLKKPEFNRDGNPNPPIRIYNGNDTDWEAGTAIGNGSLGDVKVDIRDYGVGKKKGIYPVAVRVTEHVEYQSSEFGAMDVDREDVPEVKAKKTKKDTFKEDFGLGDDLDDEIGF